MLCPIQRMCSALQYVTVKVSLPMLGPLPHSWPKSNGPIGSTSLNTAAAAAKLIVKRVMDGPRIKAGFVLNQIQMMLHHKYKKNVNAKKRARRRRHRHLIKLDKLHLFHTFAQDRPAN